MDRVKNVCTILTQQHNSHLILLKKLFYKNLFPICIMVKNNNNLIYLKIPVIAIRCELCDEHRIFPIGR